MSITNIYIGFWCFLKYWWELYVMYQKHWTFVLVFSPGVIFEKILNPQESLENGILNTISLPTFLNILFHLYLKCSVSEPFVNELQTSTRSATRSPKSTNNLLCNHSVIITLRTINVDLHYLNSWQVSLLLRVQSVTHSWLPLVFWLIETT